MFCYTATTAEGDINGMLDSLKAQWARVKPQASGA